MLLNQVTLSRFKSYRENTVVELQGGRSLFVGRNGAGKSNLFQAVEFVLGSRNSRVKCSDRLRFIHNANEKEKLWVELILQDEQLGKMRIRRELSVTVDSWFLNNTLKKKKQIQMFTELMGLPQTSPFFIVNHSLMTNLVVSTSNVRLKAFISNLGLLIARAFALPKEWTLLIQEERDNITEIMKTFETTENFAELQAQQERYNALVQSRAEIIAAVHERKIKELKKDIKEVTAYYTNQARTRCDMNKLALELKSAISATKLALDRARNDAAFSKVILDDLESEKDNLVRNNEKLLLSIEDLESSIRKEEELVMGHSLISRRSKKSELERRNEEALKTVESERSIVDGLEKRIHGMEQKRHNLLLKAGCSNKFGTVEELKRWIREELGRLSKEIENNAQEIAKFESKIQDITQDISSCEKEIKVLDEVSSNAQALIDQEWTLKRHMNELQSELNELLRREALLLNQSRTEMQSLQAKRAELLKLGASFKGYESVEKVLTSLNKSEEGKEVTDKCFGVVMDNFQCNPALYPAINAAVGLCLFWQIVETDRVGTQILREMNNQKLPGEVSFLSLNRLRARPALTEVSTTDVKLLLRELSYPESIDDVMKMLFGNVLLCRDLDVAIQSSRQYCCTCVTLEGDVVKRSGELSGGFVNPDSTIQQRYEVYKSAKLKYRGTLQSLQDTDQQIIAQKSSIESVFHRIQHPMRSSVSDQISKRRNLEKRIESLKIDMVRTREKINKMNLSNLTLASKQQTLLQMEQEGRLTSSSESVLLENLNREMIDVIKVLNKHVKSLVSLESTVLCLKSDLSLCKDIDAEVDEVKLRMLRSKLSNQKIKAKLLTSRLASVEEKLKSAATQFSTYSLQVEELERNLNDKKKSYKEAETDVGMMNVTIDKDAVDHYKKELAEEEAALKKVKKYIKRPHLVECDGKPEKELLNQLASMNQEITKLAEDRVSDKKMKQLQKRFDNPYFFDELLKTISLCEGIVNQFSSWIKEHVAVLLEEIFKLFSQFFALIVERGEGRLSFDRSSDPSSLGNIVVNVLFADGNKTVSDCSSLSTGQKCVVLLSIVFAFLKTQNVSFCLMDEVDQSLSPGHVRGLARAMREFDAEQFLISSHSMLMVESCQRFFAVEYPYQSSRIRRIERGEALEKMEHHQFEERKPSTSQTFMESSQSSVVESTSQRSST